MKYLLLILLACSQVPKYPYSQEPDIITKMESGVCYSYACKDGKYRIIKYHKFQGRYIRKDWAGPCVRFNEDELEDINCYIK